MIAARRIVACVACAAHVLGAGGASAQTDPAAAREHLKEGYAFKVAGRCTDAVPHFVESQRLDPSAKTLLNLADCEEQLGKLGEALKHVIAARARARSDGESELLALAEERLVALDGKMPRLTVTLAPDTPRGAEVTRDDIRLGDASIGMPLPVDPGRHVVVLSTPNREDQTAEITLREGQAETLTIGPGVPRRDRERLLTAGAASAPTRGPPISSYIAGGAGLVLVGVGAYLGLDAASQWSNAKEMCGRGCPADHAARSERDDAVSAATWSTIAFAAGGAAIAAAAVLWLVDRGHARRAGDLPVASFATRSGGAVLFGGAF